MIKKLLLIITASLSLSAADGEHLEISKLKGQQAQELSAKKAAEAPPQRTRIVSPTPKQPATGDTDDCVRLTDAGENQDPLELGKKETKQTKPSRTWRQKLGDHWSNFKDYVAKSRFGRWVSDKMDGLRGRTIRHKGDVAYKEVPPESPRKKEEDPIVTQGGSSLTWEDM